MKEWRFPHTVSISQCDNGTWQYQINDWSKWGGFKTAEVAFKSGMIDALKQT